MLDFEGIYFGDVHKGHRRVPTSDIIKGLDLLTDGYRKPPPELKLILCGGDLYDRCLEYWSEDAMLSVRWSHRFTSWLEEHNIVFVCLEGTPSHDWRQSRKFAGMSRIADIRYVDKLSIMRIESLDLSILCVPDEWSHSAEDTLRQVKELFISEGITKVDFALMHGYFHYQLPTHIKSKQRHSEEEYLSLVSEYIFISHVHEHNPLGRIVPAGSLDRLTHNEEHPKGYIRFGVKNNVSYYKFVENPLAHSFVTLKTKAITAEDMIREFSPVLKGLRDGSHVRIVNTIDKANKFTAQELQSLFPRFNITYEFDVKLPENKSVVDEIAETVTETVISKNTVKGLLRVRLTKYGTETTEKALRLLDDFM